MVVWDALNGCVLDEFKTAGVFVNWWQTIRYDLKTVESTGWHHTLIPDSYLIAEYFQLDADAIETLEANISETQSQLTEAVEVAAEAANFEADDNEEDEVKLTATSIKKYLKDLIDDLVSANSASAIKELEIYKKLSADIIAIEALIKTQKATLKLKQNELTLKLTLKRIGGDDAKAETQRLINQTATAMVDLNPAISTEKKKINALTKDKTALELRLTKIDSLLLLIGGQLTEDDAKRLILKKLHDIANTELLRYLNAEKRSLIAAVDNLWDKYAVSNQALEQQREHTLTAFSQFMSQLKYLPTTTSWGVGFMQAIELETQIQQDGQICLPEIYKNWFGKHAKLILLESTEPAASENTAFAIFSQLDLGEGDETLVSSAEAKQGLKAILQHKIKPWF